MRVEKKSQAMEEEWRDEYVSGGFCHDLQIICVKSTMGSRGLVEGKEEGTKKRRRLWWWWSGEEANERYIETYKEKCKRWNERWSLAHNYIQREKTR